MNRPQRAAERDQGFTLIELLVVIIIIGLLAAIAIPVFLNQRTKAYRASAVSDARNVASALEGHRTDNAYPSAVSATASEVPSARLSPGNEVGKYATTSGGEGFRLCVVHMSGTTADAYAVYDSTSGGLVASGTGTPPSADCAGGPPALVNGVRCPQIEWVNYYQNATTAQVHWQLVTPEPTVFRFDFPTPGATSGSSILLLGNGMGWAGMQWNRSTGINFNVMGVATGHDGRSRSDCAVSYSRAPN